MISIIRNRSIAFKLVFFILSSCVIIFAGIFTYNYNASRGMLIEKIKVAAGNLISGTAHEIETKILPAEKVPEYLSIAMSNPEIGKDEIVNLIRAALKKNPEIYGSTIAFEPYQFKKDLYSYSPYLYRDGSKIKHDDLGADSYNYFDRDWYKLPKKLGHSVWSEPYYDTGGGDTLMVTYSVPFYRQAGGKKKFAGVATADISLAWLEKMVSSLRIGKTGYGFLVSEQGRLITHPNRNLVMKKKVLKMHAAQKGGALHVVGKAMSKREIGVVLTKDMTAGKKIWVAYAPVPTTGWSLAAVFPKAEMMEDLDRLNRMISIAGMIGLVFLAVVIILFSNSITRPLKALALRARNIATGNLDFDLSESDSKDEVGNLVQAFRYMKSELTSHIERLTTTTQEKEKIESELKIASTIQLSTLPRVIPPYTGRDEFEICATMKPAKDVGGDFYDFYFIDDEHLAFTIGDISGKGVPAAIYMAIAKTYIQSVAKMIKTPEEVLDKVNKELARDNISAMFVTVFFGILNIKTGEISYANAGHNPPIVIRKHQDPEFFKGNGGCVLGAFEDAPMGGGKIQFYPGDVLYMYTDGVTEAMNFKNEEFTDERLKETLVACKDASVKEMVEETLTGIEDFSSGAPQADDITILVLKYFGRDGNNAQAGKMEKYQIKNDISDIRILANFLKTFGQKNGFSEDVINDVNLSLEEIIHNTIAYGYEDDSVHLIDVDVSFKGKELVLKIVDDAAAFNPLDIPSPDVDQPINERAEGGLGIFLVRNIMDKVEYKRIRGKNILLLKKTV